MLHPYIFYSLEDPKGFLNEGKVLELEPGMLLKFLWITQTYHINKIKVILSHILWLKLELRHIKKLYLLDIEFNTWNLILFYQHI